MCDYFVMCDGPQAAAAYVSGEAETTNTILGTDILKIGVVVLIMIGVVLQLAGINMSSILMGDI
jgi:hypothetical protein